MSIAGEAAAEAQKHGNTLDYYNLEIGPVGLRFQGDLGVELNDNVRLSSTDREADVIFRPALNTRVLWPVTDQNTLTLVAGVGYEEHLFATDLNRWFVTPNTSLAFHLYVGDFVINLHNNLSITEDVAQNSPSLGGGSAAFSQLENITGVGADWDLNQLVVSFGYDHDLVTSITGGYGSSDHSSELFYTRASLSVSSATKLGLLLGAGLTSYTEQALPGSTYFNAGPFYSTKLTSYLSVTISGGLAIYWFDPVAGLSNQESQVTAYFGDITFNNRLNRWLDQTLSAGRNLSGGISSALLDEYYVRYQANWRFIRNTTISTHFSYLYGKQINGVAEVFQQYGCGLNFGYQISEKMRAGVSYDFYLEDSDVASVNYFQNRLVFDFIYSF